MGRRPCCDKMTVKRGAWSPEEDAALKLYVQSHGSGGNWITLPQKAGLRRCGKSCRLRWLNYLRPNIKHGGFTHEEDSIICTLYNQIGSRWSVIASRLPGRTDNDVKNYWNTKLKKKMISAGLLRRDAGENVNKDNDNHNHHHHSSFIINEPRFEFEFDFPNHFDQCYSYLFPKQPDHQIDTYSDLFTPIGFYTNNVDVERSSNVSDLLECKQPFISDNSEAFHGYDDQMFMDTGFGTGSGAGSGIGFLGHDEEYVQGFTEAAGSGTEFQSHGFAYRDDIM